MSERYELPPVLLAVVLATCTAACGEDDGAAGPNSLSLSNRLDGAPSEASEAIVLWSVTSGSPDYVYAWGRAPVSSGAFALKLAERPPAEAVNSYGLGIGLVVIAPRSVQIHDGKQEDEDAINQVLGASERYAIVFTDHAQANTAIDTRAAAAGATPEEVKEAKQHWLFDFPEGYACGVGKPAAAGEKFDSYEPASCSDLKIRFGDLDDFEFPNWT